ncbi:hypothetical protein Ahy_A07g037206 [Arachis hypogaea]|uniref:Ubiquitin-like protease family profile domain-containing protein n=1 Tax=Arachis hypogaea TaxID=3818 RepID=A0A445CI36_ARAHY|nr:hypothetical protein Ahy_A07g037206 [Arachis hypogaea]
MHWKVGTPKLTLGGNILRPCTEQQSTDKAFNDFPGFEQLDCTIIVCEVFAHSTIPLRANKIPKVEQASHEMVFDPTANMDLTYNECHIATYVYAKTDDLDEVLFKFYELEVVRGIFHSLIPKFVPRSDIVNIVVVFASQRALRDTPIRFWFLPSPFAVDVIQLRPIDAIIKKYLCHWMLTTTKLEKNFAFTFRFCNVGVVGGCVIIPICEPNHSWYIMGVHVKQGKVYSLDITKTDDNMECRERNMRTIVSAMPFPIVSPDPTTWGPINYPKGVSSLLDRDNSDVWCLYWLLNDGLLDHRRLSVMMSENVRMKTATSIILSYWNQKKRVVDQEAEKLWRTLMRAHD